MRIDVQPCPFEHALSRLAVSKLTPPAFTTELRVAELEVAISGFNDVNGCVARSRFARQAVWWFSLMLRNRGLGTSDMNTPALALLFGDATVQSPTSLGRSLPHERRLNAERPLYLARHVDTFRQERAVSDPVAEVVELHGPPPFVPAFRQNQRQAVFETQAGPGTRSIVHKPPTKAVVAPGFQRGRFPVAEIRPFFPRW